MSKESRDEGPNNEGNRAGSENPYTSPVEGSQIETERTPSGFAAAMKSLGLMCAVLLLIVVVGFGLLIGCCSMGGMQGN
jgi:hypothetical protein